MEIGLRLGAVVKAVDLIVDLPADDGGMVGQSFGVGSNDAGTEIAKALGVWADVAALAVRGDPACLGSACGL
jgi:hypothetical protein